jgi:hypothetical protein
MFTVFDKAHLFDVFRSKSQTSKTHLLHRVRLSARCSSLSHVSAATCSSSLSRAHVVHLFGIISSTRGRTQPLTATPAHGVLGSWHPASLSRSKASRAEPSLSLQALNAEPLQARFRRALSSLGQTGVLLRLQGNTISFMRSMWSRGSGVTRVFLH